MRQLERQCTNSNDNAPTRTTIRQLERQCANSNDDASPRTTMRHSNDEGQTPIYIASNIAYMAHPLANNLYNILKCSILSNELFFTKIVSIEMKM